MLLPGTACKWQFNFKYVLDELAKKYRIIAVNYDGFEGDNTKIFPDMLTVTEKIENYILENYGGKIDGAYHDPSKHIGSFLRGIPVFAVVAVLAAGIMTIFGYFFRQME